MNKLAFCVLLVLFATPWTANAKLNFICNPVTSSVASYAAQYLPHGEFAVPVMNTAIAALCKDPNVGNMEAFAAQCSIEGKIINPTTGRCVKRNGRVGQTIAGK